MSDPGLEPGRFSAGNTANPDGSDAQDDARPYMHAGFSDPELSQVIAIWPKLTPEVKASVLVLVRGF